MHVSRLFSIPLTLLVLAACGKAGKSAPSDDGTPASAATATARQTSSSVGSPDTAEVTSSKPGIQLEEILYRPKQGAASFIELANAGADPVSLQQLTLMIDATPIALGRARDPSHGAVTTARDLQARIVRNDVWTVTLENTGFKRGWSPAAG